MRTTSHATARLSLTTLRSGKANKEVKSANKDRKKTKESKIAYVRQQAENLTYASCNRITELSRQQRSRSNEPSLERQDSEIAEGGEKNKLIQFRILDEHPDDTATWLYSLVFEPLTQSKQDLNSQSTDMGGGSLEMTIGIHAELQMAIYEPGVSSSIIDKLLADWTTDEQNIRNPEIEQNAAQDTNDCKCDKGGKQFITFNAVGQQFIFPFHLIRKWKVS